MSSGSPLCRVEHESTFAAAVRLPGADGGERTFGHNFRLVVAVEGTVDPRTHRVTGAESLASIVDSALVGRIDHTVLNAVVDVPTPERVVVWMWDQLQPRLAGLCELRLWSSRDTCVVYRGQR